MNDRSNIPRWMAFCSHIYGNCNRNIRFRIFLFLCILTLQKNCYCVKTQNVSWVLPCLRLCGRFTVATPVIPTVLSASGATTYTYLGIATFIDFPRVLCDDGASTELHQPAGSNGSQREVLLGIRKSYFRSWTYLLCHNTCFRRLREIYGSSK